MSSREEARRGAQACSSTRDVWLESRWRWPRLRVDLEGLYNHVIKNLVYFGGASEPLMVRLFPPPVYEMPDDVLFEITGMLQIVPATVAARCLFQMLHRTG